MSRDLETGADAALQGEHVSQILFLEFDFASGASRVCSREHDVEWNGFTWVGAGRVGQVEPVGEGGELEARGLAMTLSALPSGLLATALTPSEYKGRNVSLWFGQFAEDYQANVLADLPVAYWRLGERDGSVAEDISGNEYDGEYVGSVFLGESSPIAGDHSAAAARFPGDSTAEYFLKDPFNGFPGSDLSCEFWVKCTGSSDGMVAYGGGNNFMFFGQTAINIYMGTNIATGVNVADGEWHHLVLTWVKSSGDLKLYKDGAEAFSGTHNAGGTITNGLPLFIGQEPDSGTPPYNFDAAQAMPGTVCELAFYDQVLTPERVLAHYQVGTGRRQRLLVASPIGPFIFKMDQLTYQLGQTATLRLSAESRLADWNRPRVRRYNNADHQALHPGDRFFEHTEKQIEAVYRW